MGDFGKYSYLILESDFSRGPTIGGTRNLSYDLRGKAPFGDLPITLRVSIGEDQFSTYGLDYGDKLILLISCEWCSMLMIFVSKTQSNFLCYFDIERDLIVFNVNEKKIYQYFGGVDKKEYILGIEFEKYFPSWGVFSFRILDCCHGFLETPQWIKGMAMHWNVINSWYVAGGSIYLNIGANQIIIKHRPRDNFWGIICCDKGPYTNIIRVVVEEGKETVYLAIGSVREASVYKCKVISWGSPSDYEYTIEQTDCLGGCSIAIGILVFNNIFVDLYRSINQENEPSGLRMYFKNGAPVIHHTLTLREATGQRRFEEFAGALQDVSQEVIGMRLPREVCFLIFKANECCE